MFMPGGIKRTDNVECFNSRSSSEVSSENSEEEEGSLGPVCPQKFLIIIMVCLRIKTGRKEQS